MANTMKITMDDQYETSIETSDDILILCNGGDEDSVVQVKIDRAEEFIGHIWTVLDFYRKQKERKDAGAVSEEG